VKNENQSQFDFDTYNGTAGYVNRPASKERAIRQRENKVLSDQAQRVLYLLNYAGKDGMTWREIGEALDLHHGQISGLLSNMHQKEMVFSVIQIRDRCHPYVHKHYRSAYKDNEVYDQPARTSKVTNRETITDLMQAIKRCQDENYNFYAVQALNELYAQIEIQLNTKGETK
jgi:DNA-binding transcriptional regulator GbsR (MarR family)